MVSFIHKGVVYIMDRKKFFLKKPITFTIIAFICLNAFGAMSATIIDSSSSTNTFDCSSSHLEWITGYQGAGNIGSNIGKGICIGPDDRIFATGQVAATTLGYSNIPVVALHPTGLIDWVYEYDGGNFDMGYAIIADTNGNIYVTGESDSPTGDYRFTVFSVNSVGEFRWDYHVTMPNPSAGFDIIIAPDGHIYVAGVYNMGSPQQGFPGNAYLVSLTTDGVERWTHIFDSPDNEAGSFKALTADADSNIYAVGRADKKYLIFSITNDGVPRWTEMHSGSATGMWRDNEANDIIVGSDGNIYVTGKFDEVDHSRVFMTMSFTSNGTFRWEHMHAGSSGHADVAWAITEGPDESIYVAGKGVEAGTGDVWVVIKYDYHGLVLWIHFENPTSGINGLNSIAVSQQGIVYACGWTAGGIFNGPRFGVLCLSSNGDLIFSHVITPSGESGTGDQVVVGNNGVAYMVGFTMPSGSVGELQVAAFYHESINHPPYEPREPFPSNGSTDVSINVTLSWIGGDPDPGDIVTYDVYFGISSTPDKVVSNQSNTTFSVESLSYLTTYYWRIVSWDNHGAYTEGKLWEFTTKQFTENDLVISIDGGKGVHLHISNNGENDVNDVTWEIIVEGGILGRINEKHSGTINISSGELKSVGTGVFLGFGVFRVTVTVLDKEKTVIGFQFIINSIIR